DTGCVMLAADDRTVVSGRDRTRPGDRVTCPTAAYFLHGVTLHPVVKLHVDTVVPNATGKAFFRHLSPGGTAMPWDRNAANDTATLVLNPTTDHGTSGGGTASSGGTSTGGSDTSGGTSAGTTGSTGAASGGTSGSATSGTSGTAGTSGTSGDGSLASTGTGAAPLLAAMAGTACAAGAAVLLVVRSRRRGDRGTGGATGA
ncbi:MAG: hypothetical protein FWE15_10390, partial [Actinomycetia bacterium]|nr:hypothetical protein [Actinomycetes bacterium]